MNPAFTGFRNSLAVDLSVRRQWIGFAGAPKAMFVTAHSPLNNSKVSLGGFFQQWEAGPVKYNNVSLDYSYLVRLSNRVLLSLGINAGVLSQRVGLSDILLDDVGDPYFQGKYSEMMPTVGAGFVLFTPVFYVGVSRPAFPVASFSMDKAAIPNLKPMSQYYATTGMSLSVVDKIKAKISVLARLTGEGPWMLDNTAQLFYSDMIGLGFSYRPQHSTSVSVMLQATRNLGFAYSYDIALPQTAYIGRASHEITLSYDCYMFYRRNKYRMFKKKKADLEDGSDFRSIRFF